MKFWSLFELLPIKTSMLGFQSTTKPHSKNKTKDPRFRGLDALPKTPQRPRNRRNPTFSFGVTEQPTHNVNSPLRAVSEQETTSNYKKPESKPSKPQTSEPKNLKKTLWIFLEPLIPCPAPEALRAQTPLYMELSKALYP